MQRSSVVLPEPDAPMITTVSPSATSRLTSFSTTLSPKDLVSPRTRTSGSPATAVVTMREGFARDAATARTAS